MKPNGLTIQDRTTPNDLEDTDIREKGRTATGETIATDRRLFMQFMAFGDVRDTRALVRALEDARLAGVLYEDINDPRGVGLLTFSESPDYFLNEVRGFLTHGPFADLTPKPEHTMLGRTYTIGYESDLDETLVYRPRRRVCDPNLPWAIWYPLRRSGTFEQLSPQEQNVILMEHGGIGRAFGRAKLGYDIRLACYGLDKHDNDFVVGLVGPQLYPLSMIVQRMRKTKQTSLHLERLGPFFIGKVAWQASNDQ
ncbi:MAG TPA: chlorite dismutase family protein [Caldilineaceae bacterium]|nr:chlorite dismutase family protein [Caldilineaceae bacterium]